MELVNHTHLLSFSITTSWHGVRSLLSFFYDLSFCLFCFRLSKQPPYPIHDHFIFSGVINVLMWLHQAKQCLYKIQTCLRIPAETVLRGGSLWSHWWQLVDTRPGKSDWRTHMSCLLTSQLHWRRHYQLTTDQDSQPITDKDQLHPLSNLTK